MSAEFTPSSWVTADPYRLLIKACWWRQDGKMEKDCANYSHLHAQICSDTHVSTDTNFRKYFTTIISEKTEV